MRDLFGYLGDSRRKSMLVAGKAKKAQKTRAEVDAADRRIQCASAAKHISNYFADLDVPPDVDLHCVRYIEMCLDLDTSRAVDMAYGSMKSQGRFQSSCGDGTMGEDVRLVIRLLKGVRAKCVPQEFSAGILLMHLEIMEGLRF